MDGWVRPAEPVWIDEGLCESLACCGWVIPWQSTRDPQSVHVMGGTYGSKVFCTGTPWDVPRTWISALGALADACGELFDVIEDFPPGSHLVEDLLLRVHHRGVVAAECLADLR